MYGFFSLILLINLWSFNPGGKTKSMKEETQNIITVEIITDRGNIILELYPDRAPLTVYNFVRYVKEDYYDGLIFHRVVKNFVIQGGGFQPGLVYKEPFFDPVVNEAANSELSNLRGTIAMARTSDPNSATSQFFINTCDNDRLDWDKCSDRYGYCVFGKVTEGMYVVDEIENLPVKTVGPYENVPTVDVMIEDIIIHEDM
ncbi:peptidylprolyl isomerase [candidate division WOR-3 bacterium]|nr:peptidylprolyl isomerase [candidate division WOR-3 bacterium]